MEKIQSELLRKAEEDAELSQARFLQLTAALPAMVFTATDAGELTFVNERWRSAGLNELGSWLNDPRLHPEDSALCATAWQRAVETGEEFSEEVRLMVSDGAGPGSERWNLIHAVPVHRSGVKRTEWVCTCTDLTERKEREAALRMTEKLALSGRMTSVIAHEINNPLEAITNLMYLIRSELPEETSSQVQDYILLAESELERISGITKQTLRWGRENPDRIESITVSAIFEDVQRLFAGKIRNRSVTVETVGDGEIVLYGIIGQLRQVVANLLSNSLDAVPLHGKIQIEAHRHADTIELIVRDNGNGMTEETLRTLFQPFITTKGDLGNGLGLYISKEIVERHGGHIVMESEPGAGTLARVTLPAAA